MAALKSVEREKPSECGSREGWEAMAEPQTLSQEELAGITSSHRVFAL